MASFCAGLWPWPPAPAQGGRGRYPRLAVDLELDRLDGRRALLLPGQGPDQLRGDLLAGGGGGARRRPAEIHRRGGPVDGHVSIVVSAGKRGDGGRRAVAPSLQPWRLRVLEQRPDQVAHQRRRRGPGRHEHRVGHEHLAGSGRRSTGPAACRPGRNRARSASGIVGGFVIRHWPFTLTSLNCWSAAGAPPRLCCAPTYWPVPLNDARTVPVTSTVACRPPGSMSARGGHVDLIDHLDRPARVPGLAAALTRYSRAIAE